MNIPTVEHYLRQCNSALKPLALCTSHNGSLCLKTANVLWVFSALRFVRFNVTLKLQGHECLLGNFHPGRRLLRVRHVRQNLSAQKKKKRKKNDWSGRAKLWKTVETWKYWERFRRNTKSIVKVHFKVPFCTGFELNTLIWNTPGTQAVKNLRVWNTRKREKKESSSAEWEMNVRDLHLHDCSRRKLTVTCLTVQFAWSFTLKGVTPCSS